MKTHRPILFVLLFAILGVLLFIYSSWKDSQRFKTAQHWINHTNEVLRQMDQIKSLVVTEESNVRGYSITGNPVFLNGLPETNKTINNGADHLLELIKDNKDQFHRAELLKKVVQDKILFQERLIQIKKTNPDSAQYIVGSLNGKRLMDRASELINEMRNVETKLLQVRISENKVAAQQSLNTTIAGSLVVSLFIVIILIRLNSDITRRHRAESELQQSETRYRQFVEEAGVITYTTNESGFFTFISKQVRALTGYSAEELLNKHFTLLIRDDWRKRVAGFYEDQVSHRVRETSFVFPITHKDAITRWVEQDAILLLNDRNDLRGFQCVVKDVTEKTLVEQKLKAAEEETREYQYRIQAILDNTPLIIYIKDLEGKYTLVNKQFKETFNLTDEEVIGKTVFEIDQTPSSQKYLDADNKVLTTRKPVELEDILNRNGKDHHLLTVKFPLFDQNEEIFGLSGFMKDITEMVRYREALIEAREKAESAEMLQEQFLANMSHEIRTPMNGILGMSSLLMETPLESNQREYVQIIRQSSDNLMVLINDILDLSKIKAGKISLERIAFDLGNIIQPLIATFELRAAEKNVGFSVSLYPDVPQYLTGDPYRLNQILLNLLSNAFKFTEKGFVTMQISLESQLEDQVWIRLKVSDSGIGIKKEQLNYIFESFSQAALDTTRKYGGTGLGLAITKQLVELQQGTINVSSEPGAGTAFSVTIPYRISADDEIARIHPAKETVYHPDDSFEGKHVLIVEDNEVNQRVLQYNLERHKIQVTVVADGSEAVEWLRENHTDLVMMDLHMPVMDGFQATLCIRRDLKLTTPIVILTAGALKNEQQKCLSAGANDYLTKPLAPEHLLNCLDKYLLNKNVILASLSSIEDKRTHEDFDLSDLIQLQDMDSIRVVFELFEATLPAGLQELRNVAIKNDWNAVYEQAHKLKSSLGVIQVKELLSKMATIENYAKNKRKLNEIVPMIEEAIITFNEVLPKIRIAIENVNL